MKIPKNAKKVFKGVIFDVYQWKQKMFDGSSATFEMLDRPNTAIVIPTQKQTISIAHESQPMTGLFYSLFGGRIEKKEQPLKAAKRELLEESGLISHNWKLIKIYQPYYRINWKIYLYAARDCEKIANQKLDPGEKINVKKVDFEQFYRIVQSKGFWGTEFANDLFRIKNDQNKLIKFKKILFGEK